MPKGYRIKVTMYDEAGTEIASTEHEETYEDDEAAKKSFQEKEQAARGSGKGKP